MSVLYVVATPIGNLGDITLRALETLKAADIVACEDTRRTLGLLTHFGIKKPLISCRAGNEKQAASRVVSLLDKGKSVAYASDAGTPSLSDPGGITVRQARDAGHAVVPIPGASAFAAIVSVAGGMDKAIIFEGFLPQRPGRRESRINELMRAECAFVVYESPFRIVKLLSSIAEKDRARNVVVGREMTKLHEEIVSGSAEYVKNLFLERDKAVGEFSVYVSATRCSKALN